MTPQERLRHARDNKFTSRPFPDSPSSSSEPPLPIDTSITDMWDRVVQLNPPQRDQPVHLSKPRGVNPDIVTLVSSKRDYRPELPGRRLEQYWSECLVYPLRLGKMWFGLALLLTAGSIVAILAVPEMLEETQSDLVLLFWVPVLVLVIGTVCAFLDCVLASAVAGEVCHIVWSGNPWTQVAFSGVRWLLCFLAGPVVFAVMGWYYWLRCGDPGIVDWLILIELGIAGIGWWLFVLMSVADRGRLRDLNPVAVVDLIQRLGWRRALAVLAGALLLLGNAWFLVSGVAEMHTHWFSLSLILTAGWVHGMYWSTFFCRLLGLWCRQSRPAVA